MGEIKNTAMDSFYAEGIADERLRILAICNEIAVSNDIGDYIYLSDLKDYLVDPDAPFPRSLLLALMDSELMRIKKLSMRENSPAEIIRSMASLEAAMNSIREAKLLVN